MPSDPLPNVPRNERVSVALAALAGSIAAFRSATVASLERVRAMLTIGGGATRARQELGAFAASHIDADRFAELSRGSALDGPARARIARCVDVLREIADLSDDAFVVAVSSEQRPADVANAALARLGRGYHAAIVADLVRLGADDAHYRDGLDEPWGLDRWTKANRRTAPPLLLTVAGPDLRVAALADLLDGGQRIVLVVHGACAPAPLARLITPGTLVLQTTDATGLDRFASFAGPSIAALVPDGAATFLHDPERGAASWQRLQIWDRPAAEPRRTIGGMSPWQQREDLRQLDALATQPTLPAGPIDDLLPRGQGSATDRLADWLLAQSGLAEGK